MKKKIAIIGSGIAGLTLANFLYKDKKYDFMVYEKNESLPLDEGYGIQLSINSIKIFSTRVMNKIRSGISEVGKLLKKSFKNENEVTGFLQRFEKFIFNAI